jgi:pimeloyl-ACP methyl ester carboxylesterase
MEMVEDAVRLLDHLKIDKAHVVGYSMGGAITLKLLATHPERVRSAVVGGAGWSPPDPSQRMMEEFADGLDQGKGFRPLLERLTPAGQPKPTDAQVKFFDLMMTSMNDVKALAAVVRGFRGLAVLEASLKGVRVPTLAVVGSLDSAKQRVDALEERLPGLRVVVVDGADHMTILGRPEFLGAIRAFLAAHRQAGDGAKSPAGGGG